MRVVVLMLLAWLMSGCASTSVPLPEESMRECERLVKMTERVYLDQERETVLAAATRLFALTGGGYVVTRTADGLTAHRTWPPVEPAQDVPFDGSDTWQLVVKEVTVCRGGPKMGYIEAVEGDPFQEVRG